MVRGIYASLEVLTGLEEEEEGEPVRSLMEMFLLVVLWAAVFKAWILLTRRGRTIVGG